MEKKNNPFRAFWHSDRLLNGTLFALIAAFFSFTAFRMLYIQHKTFAGVCIGIACAATVFIVDYIIQKTKGSAYLAVRIRANKMVLLSMLFALVLTFFVFAVYMLSPFGNYTILRMDLYHQYGPLFAELYDKIASGKSLFYSWNSAGGSGFLGNFFNYLSSPFSVMIFWFSRKEVVTTGISVIVFAKCIASTATFSYYIRKRFGDDGMHICAFAVSYAFSAYFISYFWNVMWLDAMILFPLVLLGIERIIERSNAKLYFVALIGCFLTNYYMSYMVCIFSAIYFVLYYLAHYSLGDLYVPKTRDLPKSSYIRQSRFLCTGMRFAFTSVLAVLCCAAVLLPIYKILSTSSATNNDFPSQFKTYFDIYDFIVAHLAALEPTVRSSGGDVTPNIYCGILSVVLFPLFLMSKRISWKEKTASFLLLAFLFVTCNNNITNYIWHGFHFPNDLPYRFSFMYSFILLICAYKVLRYIRDYNYKTLLTVGGVLVFVVIAAQKFEFRFANNITIYASIAFIVLYTFILCATVSKKLTMVMTGVVLCCAVLCETLICEVPKFAFGVQESDYNSNYHIYRKAIERVEAKDNTFYRIELNDLPTNLRMSPCWYNYEGLNFFSSMANEEYTKAQARVGNFSNRINSMVYHTQTPVYNMMFNVKYIIDNSNPMKLNETYFKYLGGNSESLTTYQNNYASSIAFAVNRSLLKGWSTKDSTNPFELQSRFLELAADTQESCFEKVQLFTNGAQNCSITAFDNGEDGDGSLSYSVFNAENDADFGLTFTADKAGQYYLFIGAVGNFEKADIKTDSYTKTQEIDREPYILDLGLLKKSEEVDIKNYIDTENDSGTVYVWAVRLNDKVFQNAYKKLNDEGMMRVSTRTDTYIKGEVTLNKSEILYTSIPYDEGWNCFVDSVQVKPYALNDTLLALEAGEGTHTVEFKYTPRGLKTGIAISAVCFGGIALFFILKKVLICVIAKLTTQMLQPNQS